MLSRERGVAILEVIVAVAILGITGVMLIEIVGENMRAFASADAREWELLAEERILASHTLLTRTELDRRLGLRNLGRFVVHVQRPEPSLYRVTVSRATAPDVEDLVTVVYRPAPFHVR